MQDAIADRAANKDDGFVRDETIVRHLRQILLWPVSVDPLPQEAGADSYYKLLSAPSPGNPWFEVDDEFGSPEEFQERHYSEFVTFLPPVQRFLYGQGLGRSVKEVYGESPIKVMRRKDVAKVRVTLDKGGTPVEFTIKHVDLYLYFDVDIVLLAVELFADDIPLGIAQSALFKLGRAYPAFWTKDGAGGHCPYACELLSEAGEVLARSDYEKRDKFLSFVCAHRAPAVASHWEYLLSPLVLHHSDKKGAGRYHQLEYFRMPYMAFAAFDEPARLTATEHVRLTLGAEHGAGSDLPFSQEYLGNFEEKFAYDRYCHDTPVGGYGTLFFASGHSLVVVGDAHDPYFMDETGFLGRFRHQHFLLFMVAHFQKASLRMFSDRLVQIVNKLDAKNPDSSRTFRRGIRDVLENFLRFAHRYWFHDLSNHAQCKDLFEMTQRHLGLDGLYAEVREELHDMSNFLEMDATRRQNETVVRLTVVTILGLIGTIVTGFLGMNLFAWSEEPVWWRLLAFLMVLVPTLLLTLYTVVKSSRLSEFLEALSDDRKAIGDKLRSLARVWGWK